MLKGATHEHWHHFADCRDPLLVGVLPVWPHASSWGYRQANVPNSAPTPAVSPIASAPQNVTRTAPVVTGAPPTRAAIPPRIARNTSEIPETRRIRLDAGTMAAANSGIAAPTAKLAAEVNAA